MFFDDYKRHQIDEKPYSDIAMIHYRACVDGNVKLGKVKFGGDGSYKVYRVVDGTPLPSHYTLVDDLMKAAWVDFYDDYGVFLKVRDGVRIMRAGDYSMVVVCRRH